MRSEYPGCIVRSNKFSTSEGSKGTEVTEKKIMIVQLQKNSYDDDDQDFLLIEILAKIEWYNYK